MSIRLGQTEVQEYLNISSYSGVVDPDNYYTKIETDGLITNLNNKFTNYIPTTELSNLAYKSYVDTKVASLVNSAPGTLDTLNELATALGNDPNFATSITTELGSKLNETQVRNIIAEELGDLNSLLDEIIGG